MYFMNRKQQLRNGHSPRHSLSKSSNVVVPLQNSNDSSNEDATFTHRMYQSPTRYAHDGNTISNDLNSLWAHALIQYEQTLKDKRAEKDYQSLLCLPGSTVLPRATPLSSLHGKKQNSHKLSSTEVQHHAQANEKDTHSININTTHSFQRKYAPYIDANTKIRRALSVRKPFQTREEIRSKQLEKFMILVEKETKAAIVLQSYWRRHKAIQHLAELKNENVCAIWIQAFIRGVSVRVKWKKWKHQCHIYAIKCQAQVRRQIVSRKWNAQKEFERQEATIIQACIRSFLCKCEYIYLFRDHRVTKIQRLWRGHRGRHKFHQLKLNRYATAIQKCARRRLARKKYIRTLQEKTAPAVDIQRCWRGYVSRVLFSELAYERSLFRRRKQILLYRSDLEYLCHKMDRARKELFLQDPTAHKKMLYQTIEQCKHDLASKRQELTKEENMYSELEDTKENLTPFDIQSGWLEQTENSLQDCMKRIIDLKLEIVFKGIRRLKEAEEVLSKHEALFAEMESEKSRLQFYMDKTTKEYWKNQRLHDQKKQSIRQRQNIADEKRKWKVQALSASGKPLKKNPGPHKVRSTVKTESSGLMDIATVDIFAHDNVKDTASGEERLNQLIEQVKLSLNRNQTQQYYSTLGMVDKLFAKCQNHFNEI